jgi:hypothetical protein
MPKLEPTWQEIFSAEFLGKVRDLLAAARDVVYYSRNGEPGRGIERLGTAIEALDAGLSGMVRRE